MKKYIYLLLIIPLFFISCSDDDEPDPIDFPESAFIDISENTNWDFLVLDKNNYYYLKTNSSTNLPEFVRYHTNDANNDFSIFFNENGLVDKVIYENYTFLLRNFNGNFVDIGILYPDGRTEILREVETKSYNWETFENKKFIGKDVSNEDIVKWTGHAISGLGCAMAIASAPATFGLTSVLAGITCTSFAIRLVDEFVEIGLDEFLEANDAAIWAFSCATADSVGCLYGGASLAYDQLTQDAELIETRDDKIRAVNSELNISYFQSEFQNLDNNKIPEGWEFYKVRSADIKNGRMNSYITNGEAELIKEGYVSNSTQEIILEMDAYITYSYWGLLNSFKITAGDKRLSFYSGEEYYMFPINHIGNLVGYYNGQNGVYIHESISPSMHGIYHFKLIMNSTGYEFTGTDPNGQESFNIKIDSRDYFDFKEIEKITFGVYAKTENSGWIDNIRTTVN